MMILGTLSFLALVAILISGSVVICKHISKRRARARSATQEVLHEQENRRVGEGQEYEEIDERSLAANTPAITARGETMELQENAAYEANRLGHKEERT